MGGGDQILERATPARSCASFPVLGLLRLLFLAHGSLWACKWAARMGSQVELREAWNSFGLLRLGRLAGSEWDGGFLYSIHLEGTSLVQGGPPGPCPGPTRRPHL